MKIIETNFQGLILIEPRTFQDERGMFYESWRCEDYQGAGINEIFLQDNVSFSKKNVLRGLHYQVNQGQLVTVTHGKIFDVAVDLRPHSETYKKSFSIELEGSSPKQLYMPPGFAHGFCVLSDYAVIHYKCTQHYNSTQEGGVIWNDRDIAIEWPSCESFILSSRDIEFPTHKEWEAKTQ